MGEKKRKNDKNGCYLLGQDFSVTGLGWGALKVFFDTLQRGTSRQALSLGAFFTILPGYAL